MTTGRNDWYSATYQGGITIYRRMWEPALWIATVNRPGYVSWSSDEYRSPSSAMRAALRFLGKCGFEHPERTGVSDWERAEFGQFTITRYTWDPKQWYATVRYRTAAVRSEEPDPYVLQSGYLPTIHRAIKAAQRLIDRRDDIHIREGVDYPNQDRDRDLDPNLNSDFDSHWDSVSITSERPEGQA